MTQTRTPLTRERVLRAALELADEGGVEAVSMRKIADQLGVKAMSLYNHVANKDDVLDGMVDATYAEIAAPTPGAEWQVQVREIAISAHEVVPQPSLGGRPADERETRPRATALRRPPTGLLPQRGLLEGADLPRVPHHRELRPRVHVPGARVPGCRHGSVRGRRCALHPRRIRARSIRTSPSTPSSTWSPSPGRRTSTRTSSAST